MIEIAIDENKDDVFHNEIRPVYTINDSSAKTWEEYRLLAREVIKMYENIQILIVRNNNPSFSINWFAVALFVESCFIKNELECVAFKVTDRKIAIDAYKPFVALTIGIKYIIRLYQEELTNVYKEIAGLSYLGLNIKENYIENKIYMELPKEGELLAIKSQTIEEALIAVGILKSMALSQIPLHITAEIFMNTKSPSPNIDKAIQDVINHVSRWIN